MHSHLAIVDKQNRPLALKPGTSLTITDKNPMFNDVEMFSQPIPLPFELNRHLLGNMDDVNSTMRADDIRGSRFRVIVGGLPLRNTAIKIQEGTLINDTIDVNFDATNRTFKDMISDMRCRDVKIDDKIIVGEKIGNVEVTIDYTETYDVWVDTPWATGPDPVLGYRIHMKPVSLQETFQPIATGFSYPATCVQQSRTQDAEPEREENGAIKVKTYPNCNKGAEGDITVRVPLIDTSYINVSQPYGSTTDSPHLDKNGNTIGWPYCNTRICYAHYAAEKDKDNDNLYTGETSQEIIKAKDRAPGIEEDKSPYWVLPANRPASGLCFYVAYFLEKLFKTLDVAYDMTALLSIEDFRYLTFVSTQCHFDTEVKPRSELTSENQINSWLESRGCGGRMNLQDNVPETEFLNFKFLKKGDYTSWEVIEHPMHSADHPELENDEGIRLQINLEVEGTSEFMTGIEHYFNVEHSMTAHVLRMYANSDNFPDANVSEVIESLENLFGVRFCYDAETNKVTVRLLRDMFRSDEAPVPFKGEVLSMVKKTENIRGIRYGYNAEQEAREQRDNIRYQKRDYDTTYNYMDYPPERTKLAAYADLSAKIDVGNRNGYADLATGNFYRIKVSADASTADELQPAIFEVGQYKGVELGDCSAEAEIDDAIKDIRSSFEPVIVNDVAYRGKNYQGDQTPMLVPFIDEEMEHEFLIKKLLNPISTRWGSIDIVYELCLAECYDPSSTDDGQSPLMSHNWGLTIGFLRPARSGGGVYEYERGYDGFDNSKWAIQSSDYAITADTMDAFGTFYGTSGAGSFSLKPRAFKPFRYKYENEVLLISTNEKEWDDTWLIPCDADERNAQGVITRRIRSRGTCDTWMIEFFHFLLHAQLYEVKALCTAAELADVPNKWLRRWEIDGKIGWMNILEYPISLEKGIGEVRIEFYALM